METIKRVATNLYSIFAPNSRNDRTRARKRVAEHYEPELTDDDDEDFRPSSFFSLTKRMKSREDNKKQPVASTSTGIFPNPWRRDETKVNPKQSTSVSNRTEQGSKDIICLNGGSGTTSSSTRRNMFQSGFAVSVGLEKKQILTNVGKPLKAPKQTLFDTMKTNNKRAMFTRSLIGTRTDTVRLDERNQYVELLDQLRQSQRGSFLASGFSKNSSPADSGRSSQAGVAKQAFSRSKIPLTELMRSHVNWFNVPNKQFLEALEAHPEKTIRVLNYSEETIPPAQPEKQIPKKDIELIDITQEESSDSSDSVLCETPVSQLKSITSPKSLTASSKKIDDLGKRISEVLNRSLGGIDKDVSILDADEDESSSVVNSSEKEDDDEIQVIKSSREREPVNSLSLEIRGSPYASENWLKNHKSSLLESRREREEKIKREKKTLEILHNESTADRDLDQLIRRNLTLTDIIVLEEQKEEAKLPEITDDMLDVIDRARASGRGGNEVITRTPNNIEITRADIKSLGSTNWLNDNVINSYLDMIAARNKSRPNNWPSVYVFTTFFYPKYLNEGYSNILKRWTRKVDLFSYDLLIFPIHLGIHWCLAAADLRHKTIKYYDSLGGKNFQCPKALLQYLRQEHQERKKAPLNDFEWKTEIVEDIPQQQNGSDCGMFACKFAEYLSRDADLTFRQEDMNYYRERMIYEIVAQDLLYP